QLASLHKISLAIASRLDLEEVLQSVLEQALQLARAERVALFLLDGEGRKLTVQASKGWPKKVQEATLVSGEGSIASEVARTQQPVLLQSGSIDLSFDGERKARGIKDALGVPLKIENRVVGVLEVASKSGEGTFTENDSRMLSLLANHAAIAINDARLYQDLQARMRELEQTQAQLLQSVKLATVGEMAASVAHEINNPLGGILGFAELLLEDTEDTDPRKADLNSIKAETIRARNIIRNWLGFARQSDEHLEEVSLNEVMRGTVDLLRRQSELLGVTLREVYGGDLPMIGVHSNQMKQVFLNVLNNALFAMPEGGNLTITTWKEEGLVAVAIEDTGVGISSENLARIFDPFFSTKPEPKGTGLGLSISQSIVLRHGGTIDVASELGRGTRFTVRLPVSIGPVLTGAAIV
ncbi:MAG: ATP-binding protein, partial [Chloroflexi bacterium]|nr:ATP-binding protein [Chloroflexota bacterium]